MYIYKAQIIRTTNRRKTSSIEEGEWEERGGRKVEVLGIKMVQITLYTNINISK